MGMNYLTRRNFLGAASLAPWLAGPASVEAAGRKYNPKLGAAMYVFTQQFNKEKKTLAQGIEEAFPAVRRAGYHRVELSNNFLTPDVLDKTMKLLHENGLELPLAYIGGVAHDAAVADKTLAAVLDFAATAKQAGVKAIVFNADPRGGRKTDEQLVDQAKFLNRLGAELRHRELRLFLHQHAPQMAEDAREWRHDLKHTDPQLLWFCLDVDWVKRGGQDPMTLLEECAPRLGDLHLRSAQQGVWMESLDNGDIDYSQVAAYLKKIKYDGWMNVELAYEKATKITRTLEEDMRLSRLFAEKTFGVKA
jgi:inosose dehydratase